MSLSLEWYIPTKTRSEFCRYRKISWSLHIYKYLVILEANVNCNCYQSNYLFNYWKFLFLFFYCIWSKCICYTYNSPFWSKLTFRWNISSTFKDHLLKSHDNIQSQLFRKHNWSLNVYKLKEISWKTNSRGQAVSNLQWEIKLFISL